MMYAEAKERYVPDDYPNNTVNELMFGRDPCNCTREGIAHIIKAGFYCYVKVWEICIRCPTSMYLNEGNQTTLDMLLSAIFFSVLKTVDIHVL